MPNLKPLQTEAERQFDIRHAPRHHSDVEFSEQGWVALRFIRWQLGLRTRSQAVNAALIAYAQQLVMGVGCQAPASTQAGQAPDSGRCVADSESV